MARMKEDRDAAIRQALKVVPKRKKTFKIRLAHEPLPHYPKGQPVTNDPRDDDFIEVPVAPAKKLVSISRKEKEWLLRKEVKPAGEKKEPTDEAKEPENKEPEDEKKEPTEEQKKPTEREKAPGVKKTRKGQRKTQNKNLTANKKGRKAQKEPCPVRRRCFTPQIPIDKEVPVYLHEDDFEGKTRAEKKILVKRRDELFKKTDKFPVKNCTEAMKGEELEDARLAMTVFEKILLTKSADNIDIEDIKKICKSVIKHQKTRTTSYDTLRLPSYIAGDIHGNLDSLLLLFDRWSGGDIKKLFSIDYVILGDLVDRGSMQIECVLINFCMVILSKGRVSLLRGNHEDPAVNGRDEPGYFRPYLKVKYQDKSPEFINTMFDTINEVFGYLRICANFENKVFLAHGGIYPGWQPGKIKEELDKMPFPLVNPQRYPQAAHTMWLDQFDCIPHDMLVYNTARKSTNTLLAHGPALTEKLMKEHGLDMLMRGHVVCARGYAIDVTWSILTVFSSTSSKQENGVGNAFVEKEASGRMVARIAVHKYSDQLRHVAQADDTTEVDEEEFGALEPEVNHLHAHPQPLAEEVYHEEPAEIETTETAVELDTTDQDAELSNDEVEETESETASRSESEHSTSMIE